MSQQIHRDWDAFVTAHPDGSIFQLSGWRDVTQPVFGHKNHPLTVERGGELCAVLPLTQVKSRLFGHALIANGFCIGGGPLASDEDALSEILARAEHLGRKLGVDYIELRDTPTAAPGWAAKDGLYAYFAKPTAVSEEDNYLQLPRRKRAVLRKVIKSGLTTTIDATVDDFYPLYCRNMHKHGTPALPRRYFERLRAVFGAACEILTVREGGRPISSVFSFYFKDRVMPYYMGARPEARDTASNDLMYWTLMRDGVARGYPIFDFSRSKIGSGPYEFKRLWGFEPRPIVHQYRLIGADSLPNVNPTNPRYATFIKAWQQLPLPIANGISPLLSRSLG
jgi:FemAB-related protein (PEP-CTERM system-associated)